MSNPDKCESDLIKDLADHLAQAVYGRNARAADLIGGSNARIFKDAAFNIGLLRSRAKAAESENERLVSEKQALIDCREQDDAEFRETLSKLNEARAENERLKEALEGAKNRLSRGQPDRSEQSREALLILSLALKENSNAVL